MAMAAVQLSLPTLEPRGPGVGSTHEAMGDQGLRSGVGDRGLAGGQRNMKAEAPGLPCASCASGQLLKLSGLYFLISSSHGQIISKGVPSLKVVTENN